MKILYLTNIPSPYRVAYFNELGTKCDLTVLFEKKSSDERDDSWNNYTFESFKGIIINAISIRTDAAICPEIIKYLKRGRYDYIVITNFSSPTGLLAIGWLQLMKIQYCIEGDGAFVGSKKGLKEKIKRWAIAASIMNFSTSRFHDDYYIAYGATDDSIYRYPFTSVYFRDVLQMPVSDDDKKEIKSEIGIQEKQMILSVGSFIYRKGFDILIKSMSDLPKNWGVYIVGGEPTEEYVKLKKEVGIDNLHFIGFKESEILKKYYKAADMFVFPTREDIWGLVINEAMSNALPIITTDRCIAGVELVRNDYNGYIVAHDSVEELKDAVMKLVESENDRKKYAKNALQIIGGYTIEKMVDAHICVWKEKLGK